MPLPGTGERYAFFGTLRGVSQYGLLQAGQTFGGVSLRGYHSCSQRLHTRK